jgi:hypothetical protein
MLLEDARFPLLAGPAFVWTHFPLSLSFSSLCPFLQQKRPSCLTVCCELRYIPGQAVCDTFPSQSLVGRWLQ